MVVGSSSNPDPEGRGSGVGRTDDVNSPAVPVDHAIVPADVQAAVEEEEQQEIPTAKTTRTRKTSYSGIDMGEADEGVDLSDEAKVDRQVIQTQYERKSMNEVDERSDESSLMGKYLSDESRRGQLGREVRDTFGSVGNEVREKIGSVGSRLKEKAIGKKLTHAEKISKLNERLELSGLQAKISNNQAVISRNRSQSMKGLAQMFGSEPQKGQAGYNPFGATGINYSGLDAIYGIGVKKVKIGKSNGETHDPMEESFKRFYGLNQKPKAVAKKKKGKKRKRSEDDEETEVRREMSAEEFYGF